MYLKLQMEESDNCPICLERFSAPKILDCRHTFCMSCLKCYSDEIGPKQHKLSCPLCRTECKIPNDGLSHLVTNYFVSISESDKCCLNCKNRLKVFGSCKLETHFVVESPQENDCHIIYSILASTGGVLVVPSGIPFILLMNQYGKTIDKIYTPYQCVGIYETNEGDLIGTFPFKRTILSYKFGVWSAFVTCPDYFPVDIVQLTNGNILTCGQKLDMSFSGFGQGCLQLYSSFGEPLRTVDRQYGVFDFPHKIAYDKEHGIIAIADHKNHTVTILHENDGHYAIYKGGNQTVTQMSTSSVQTERQICFHASGICSSSDGNFIVCTPEGHLHIINKFGELIALGTTDCEESFGIFVPDIALDNHGVIWCSDSLYGTIKTFKLEKFANNLDN
ncbi:TRIM2_3 [Mytilus coruscus]|uniref:TRIM2_3 n=1 Tax=Mytilus coruscus TaxID=42192 RepID=A0A6J8AS17_MYTCO|nr:TRIM2_3 [Mytilus coruscus]